MLKETWTYPLYLWLAKLIRTAGLSYNSPLFFFFLTGFLAVYFLLPKAGAKRIWILCGSLVFYAWSGLGALLIVLVSAGVTWLAALRIGGVYARFDGSGLSAKERRKAFLPCKKRARLWAGLSLFFLFGIWILIKLARLAGIPEGGFSEMLSGTRIVVPLGISYYTLSMTAYLFDVYRQKTEPVRNPLKLLAAAVYFPHIVQGPIGRLQNIIRQMDALPGFDYSRICAGLQLMLWGYFQKLVIADRLVIFTNAVFSNLSLHAGAELVLTLICDVVRLYADFFGCMDIVMGISTVLGIELTANFRQPFFARSVSEFWRRWHITLGEWTKEYIYFPLATSPRLIRLANRVKKRFGKTAGSHILTALPLAAVWLFTGFWHGTGADYICWGLYWFALIFGSQLLKNRFAALCKKLRLQTESLSFQCWQTLRTCLLFAVGRTFTCAGGLAGFVLLWQRLTAGIRLWKFTDGSLFSYGLDGTDWVIALLGTALIWSVDFAHEKGLHIRKAIGAQPLPVRWFVYYGAIFAVILLGIYGPGYNAADFVYGGF